MVSVDVLKARACAAVAKVTAWVKRTVTETLRPFPMVSEIVEDAFRSKEELVAENLLLRQQLIVASRKVKQPKFRPWERGLFVLLASRLRRWSQATLLVKPNTVLRWHREGFRLLWTRKSKAGRAPNPRLPQETIDLIVQMSKENRLWGAERIRGELLKLGIRVGKHTVQRYMYRDRSSGPRDGQSWKTFLKNHTVWACDFLQLYDIWFRPIFAFFVVDVNEKEVVDVAVTRAPTEQWTAQQLREVTPFGQGPQVLIRDRDPKYGTLLDRVAEGADIEVVLTAPCTPRMNSVVERFLRSVRRECTDQVIVLGERHLRCVLNEYARVYFNTLRPHQGIQQRIPRARSSQPSNSTGNVVAFPVLNGLHHHYQRVA
jgi:transposase InsO family protein